jgi:hypothetical protein
MIRTRAEICESVAKNIINIIIQMETAIKIIPQALYFFVGLVSLIMALKNLSAVKYLPFHEQASGRKWEDIDGNLRIVILFLLRITGLGFLMMGILLIAYAITAFFIKDDFLKYAIPLCALVFTSGLFLFSYKLYKKTNADTPWKKSLVIIFFLIIGFIISIIGS